MIEATCDACGASSLLTDDTLTQRDCRADDCHGWLVLGAYWLS